MSDFTNTDVLQKDAFNATYAGTPPWDIGRPQPEFVRVYDAGEITGSVLDAGCGTGEHAIWLASKGLKVLGVDAAPAAIEIAQRKARERQSTATFREADATNLRALNETFDTVIDSGLFHCFSDENRTRYINELTAVTNPGGRLIIMCFSELETRPGPRRVTQQELRAAFENDWTIDYIRASKFDSHMHEGGALAWTAVMTRKG